MLFVEMGQMAAEAALRDAGVRYDQVQAVAASYCYGDPTCGKYVNYTIALVNVWFIILSLLQVKKQSMVRFCSC